MCVCNSSTWEVKAGVVQGYPQLPTESDTSLGCMNPIQETKLPCWEFPGECNELMRWCLGVSDTKQMPQRPSIAFMTGLLCLTPCQGFCEVFSSCSPWFLQPLSPWPVLGRDPPQPTPCWSCWPQAKVTGSTKTVKICFSAVGGHHCPGG